MTGGNCRFFQLWEMVISMYHILCLFKYIIVHRVQQKKQNNQDTFIASKTSTDWVQQNTILKHFFCHFNHSKIFYHCAIKAWLWNQRKRRPRATTCHRLLFVSFPQMNKASPCRRRKAPTMTPPWLVVSFSPPLLPSFFNWIRQQSNLNQTFTPGVKDLKDLLYV